MKRELESIAPQGTVARAARQMRAAGVGFLPVCNAEGTVVGVVTDRDIALRVCADNLPPDSTPVSAIMTTAVVTCRDEDPLDQVEAMMARYQKSRVVVLNGSGHLAGIVSVTDLLQVEEPIRVARLLRQVSARCFRYEGAQS
jgi:CBS domain-containing protein